MKKIFILIVSVAFVFCFVGPCFAGDEAYTGTVTTISGQHYTIRDDNGRVTTVKGNGTIKPKVGDKVNVKNGVIIEDAGTAEDGPQPGPPL